MKIHYRIKNNAIEIVRCYGTDDRIVLPEEINGLPVVSAAPYAFSAHKDGEEDAETWESEDVISFGEETSCRGGSAGDRFSRYTEGNRKIYFYGCKKLERLEFSDTLMQVGTGAFTGCSGLKELVIHQKKGSSPVQRRSSVSCGRRSMWIFCMKMVRQVENVRIWFFRSIMMRRWRIRLREFCLRSIMAQGPITGNASTAKNWFAEYDSLFDMAVVMDKLEVLVDMSFGRLRYPWQLSEKAKKQYEDYIRGNLKDIGEFLVESGSLNGLELLSQEKLWNRGPGT